MSDIVGTQLVVTARAWIVAAWYHHLLTRPVILLDDVEQTGTHWGSNALPLGPGPHRIAASFRYKWQRTARLCEGRTEFTAEDGVTTVLRAQLGVRNTAPFRITGPAARSSD
ncbi:hypothetical protein [Kitasatospora viridis]|uniref:Uncharacterized protein n=1 Tax=Kitasatospora viridis TaxID=281105 RepID=A0A561SEZ5_9ACTN|nr:hypothetical protein [Kitasatospora viridis]TWF73412.1 hypothetical protein FHX73_1523 [Kitasatospora viridis]